MQIMKQQGLNQKDFSALTGISPATLSSIFNGRTQPTLNHAELLHRRFPNLSLNWLMFGEGDMFEKAASTNDDENASEGDQGDALPYVSAADGMRDSSDQLDFNFPASGSASPNGSPSVIREVVKFIDKPQRKITEIRIFFDDGTFEVFPGK